MKTISTLALALITAGSLLTACGGAKPEPADATDAKEATDATEEEGGKKGLEEMKGGRMEKADAEE